MDSGIVIGCPIPRESEYPDPKGLDKCIKDALREAKGIAGKEITPFLLDKVRVLTAGKSVAANIALIKNNAVQGSKIAKELQRLEMSVSGGSSGSATGNHLRVETPISGSNLNSVSQDPSIFIVGGTVMDIVSQADDAGQVGATPTSHPGTITETLGGVARNMAEASSRSGGNTRFYSAVGADIIGRSVIDTIAQTGLSTSGIQTVDDGRTGKYNALLDANGELVTAVADMQVFQKLDIGRVLQDIQDCERPGVLAVDGNLNMDHVKSLLDLGRQKGMLTVYEPTSVAKSIKFLEAAKSGWLETTKPSLITPDRHEAHAMAKWLLAHPTALIRRVPSASDFTQTHLQGVEDELEDILVLLRCFDAVVLKAGEEGVLVGTVGSAMPASSTPGSASYEQDLVRLQMQHLRVPQHQEIVSVTGAGDSLVGVVLTCLARTKTEGNTAVTHDALVSAVSKGIKAASLSLASVYAVSPLITPNVI